jgi:hypothetical protein
MIYGFLSPMTSLMDFQRFGPMTIEILIVLKLLSRKLYPAFRKKTPLKDITFKFFSVAYSTLEFPSY